MLDQAGAGQAEDIPGEVVTKLEWSLAALLFGILAFWIGDRAELREARKDMRWAAQEVIRLQEARTKADREWVKDHERWKKLVDSLITSTHGGRDD